MLTIKLNNANKIEKNRFVIVKIGDIRNPPSYFPLKGFEFRTGDHDQNFIEAAVDGVLQNSQPGVFASDSRIEVLGSTMVSEENVSYRFHVSIGNDVPISALVYIYFPTINN